MKILALTFTILFPMLAWSIQDKELRLVIKDKIDKKIIKEASEIISVVLRKDFYHVNSSVVFNEDHFNMKIKSFYGSQKKATSDRIKLPFSNIDIPVKEFEFGFNNNKRNDYNGMMELVDDNFLPLFMSTINDLTIELEIHRELTPQEQTWIKEKLAARLAYPKEQIRFTSKMLNLPPEGVILEKPLSWFAAVTGWNLAPAEFAGILLAMALLFVGFFPKREQKMAAAPQAPMQFAPQPMPQAKAPELSSRATNSTSSEVDWNHVSLNELKLFVMDCYFHPLYQPVGKILIGRVLSHEQATALKAVISHEAYEARGIVVSELQEGEIEQLFKEHLPFYRRMAESELALNLVNLDVPAITTYMKSASHDLRSLVLDELTPLKSSLVLHSLDIEQRMKISSELKKFEKLSLTQFLKAKETLSNSFKTYSRTFSPIEDLSRFWSSRLLEPRDFHEEESLTLNPKFDQAQSLLSYLITTGDVKLISQLPISTLATAMFGYSDNLRGKVEDVLSASDKKWFSEMCRQFQNQKLAYDSYQVVEARKALSQILTSSAVEMPPQLRAA